MYKLQTQMKELDPSDPHYLEQKEVGSHFSHDEP
jgi:hypothetical protein